MLKVNSIWKCLRSPKASEALRELLGLALKKPVVTRWNSLFDALQQLVTCKEKILCLSARDRSNIPIRDPMTTSDFRYLEEYLKCTKDLAEAIDLLQGESNCHYGYLLPALLHLKRQMLLLKDGSTISICKPIVEATIRALETRFRNFFDVSQAGKAAAIAAASHPLFKLRWLRGLPERAHKEVYDSVVDAVAEQIAEGPQITPTPAARTDRWEFGDAPTAYENLQPIIHRAAAEIEVTRYLGDKAKDLEMLKRYPAMCKVFRKFNTPLPSSAPVERLFSHATMMDLPKYNRMTDRHFEQRILAKVNRKVYNK